MAERREYIIRMPDDAGRCEALKKKEREYLQRFENPAPLAAQEQMPEELVRIDAWCKYAILSILVREGAVEARAAWGMITSRGMPVGMRQFKTAWFIIDDYAKTGGENTRGGTGLRRTDDGITTGKGAEQAPVEPLYPPGTASPAASSPTDVHPSLQLPPVGMSSPRMERGIVAWVRRLLRRSP